MMSSPMCRSNVSQTTESADEQIHRKLSMFSHAHQILPGWFERVWKAWDANPTMEDLHPVNPPQFKRAVLQDPAIIPITLRLFLA